MSTSWSDHVEQCFDYIREKTCVSTSGYYHDDELFVYQFFCKVPMPADPPPIPRLRLFRKRR